uniref:LigA n=1 Tax=Parastrongyloides trichosuri TaxID=131310 RepID=A0A0N4ZXX0_PARTI
MGPASGLQAGRRLGRAAPHRGQPVTGATGSCGPAASGASGPAGDGSGRLAAGAGDHRDGHDHRHGAHHPRPASAEGPGRDHRDGRLRHRLFLAVDPARLPLRQDQAGPLLHDRTGRRGAAVAGHHPRRPDHRRKPVDPGAGRGRGDRRTAGLAAQLWLRPGAGLSAGPSPAGGRRPVERRRRDRGDAVQRGSGCERVVGQGARRRITRPVGRAGPFVLDGQVFRLAQGHGGMVAPVGVVQHGAGDRDQVGLALKQQVFSLLRGDDHADGHDIGVRRRRLDRLGEGDLIIGLIAGNAGRGDIAAAGQVQIVVAHGVKGLTEGLRLLDRDAALGPV